MSSLVAEIHSRWTMLRGREAAGPDALAVSALSISTGYGPAALGMDPQGRAQLLLPVATGVLRPVIDGLAAIEVGAATLREGSTNRAYLIVTCIEPRLDRAFADLVEAVLTRVAAGEPARDALVTSITQLRSLFSSPENGRIDDRIIRGLVAELVVLRRLAARHARAAELWLGPIPERHDFRGGAHAIEVKSSGRATGRVTISSADQLEAPSGGTLQLWRVALERTQGGSASVAQLVGAIEELTGRSTALRTGLSALGCDDPDDEAWNRLTFNCEAIDAWNVAPGFPRIVPSTFGTGSVPAGIVGLTYELDPAVASAFRVDEEAMAAMEQQLVAHL